MLKELYRLFGPDDSGRIPGNLLEQLKRLAWTGEMCEAPGRARCFCWRVLLGLLSSTDKSLWAEQLQDQTNQYSELKKKFLPTVDQVAVDPLSALSSGGSQSEEWALFYKNLELSNFIKGDLDRLYLTDVEEEYFHQPKRRDALLAILMIWSLQNPIVSYRQGMHEIAGTLLLLLEQECDSWTVCFSKGELPATHPLAKCINAETVEAQCYWFFRRIMVELQPIYDPIPSSKSNGLENQPFIVQYCTKIQEHYLRLLDPDLCSYLEECYVQAQLYGMRWSRLILGREFPVNHEFLFRIWDFLFASCFEASDVVRWDKEKEENVPNIVSVFANIRAADWRTINQKKGRSPEHAYVCTPLLGALGDFMLAMLIRIRDDLLNSDSSSVMGLLMHYPSVDCVLEIIDYADMLRRGVIIHESHLGGLFITSNTSTTDAALKGMHSLLGYGTNSNSAKNNPYPIVDEGLLDSEEDTSPGRWINSVPLTKVSRRMSDSLSAVKQVGQKVANISSDFKQSIIQAKSGGNNLETGASGSPTSAAVNKMKSASADSLKEKVSKNSPRGDNVNDSSIKNSPGNFSNPENVASTNLDIDPLMGSSVKPNPRVGQGNSYANVPSNAVMPSAMSKSVQNAGSVLNGSNSNISLFAPKTWFTAKDRVEELRVAPKEDVLLHSINGNSRNTKEYISNSSGSKEPKVNQTTTGAVSGESVRVVGQKLLDVADTLCENNRNVSPTELVFRKNTAKKLILLADVLNGLLSVQEFEDLMASETALQINVTKSESDDISNGKKLVLRDSSEVVENLRKELDSKLQGVEDKVELSTSTSSEDSVIADPQN